MSKQQTTTAPNLEFYRKRAKALLKAVRSADSPSYARVRAQLSRFDPSAPFHLSHAQWVVALEQGHSSWAEFRRHLRSLLSALAANGQDETHSTIGPKEITMTSIQTAPKGGTISDEAVRAKTGKSWKEWFDIFDNAGCANQSHKEIVAVAREQGAGSWWQQMVTVEYERARGKRDMNMSCYGEYRINVSKTLSASVADVFQAWLDPSRREQWLPGADLTIRKANENKALRITWHDGGNVDVNLIAKGETKSQCNVEHGKLESSADVERSRSYWSDALLRMKELVEK